MRSRLGAGGERGLRYGDGSRLTGTGDLGRLTGDREYLRLRGSGDLGRTSLRGEYPRGGDLGRPL